MKDRMNIETYLGVLIALLSIFTAYAAYQTAVASEKSDEFNLNAVKTLTESNTEFLRSNQEVMLDYAAYDNYVIGASDDPEVADYYRGGFSEALEAGMDREAGPFDDIYFDETFSEADLLYDEALDLFDAGQAAGEVADQIQLVMLITAVGLSLAAYASLGEKKGIVARIFIVLASLSLLFGVLRTGMILLG